MKKDNGKRRTEKLMKAEGGVSRKKEKIINCAEVSKYFETLCWKESLVEESLIKKIKKHVKSCPICKEKKVNYLLFPRRNKTHYNL